MDFVSKPQTVTKTKNSVSEQGGASVYKDSSRMPMALAINLLFAVKTKVSIHKLGSVNAYQVS